MQKVRDYLSNILKKQETCELVNCQDVFGNDVRVPNNKTVFIYNAKEMLNNLINLYSDFEKYLEYNKIKSVDGSAFIYHESLYPLSYHLAILEYCQSILIVEDEDFKKKVDLVAYEVMLKENEKVAKLGVRALKKMEKTLYKLHNLPVRSKETSEYIEEAKTGLMFQLGTLTTDLSKNYEVKKIVEETDNWFVDEKRVDFMKLVISQIAKKNFLTTPYQEEFEKQKR